MKKYTLTSDCILAPKETGTSSYLAYFPLQSLILEVNSEGAQILELLKEKTMVHGQPENEDILNHLAGLGVVNGAGEIVPEYKPSKNPQPNKTILMTSDKCMLGCLYCYKGAEQAGDLMPKEIAFAAVDTIVANALRNKNSFFEVGYHGGGEPTINWEVLTSSYEYAKEKSLKANIKFQSNICTNGMLSGEKAHWIAKNISHISVSIDGMPDIQNLQRPTCDAGPSFNQVAKSIDIFKQNHKRFSLRMTATEHTEGRLVENVSFLAERFNPQTICIEPLFVCGRCATSGCQPPSQQSFIDELKEAYLLGQEKGVQIFYSGNKITSISSRFCGAIGSNFFITPRGEVTACLEVSDKSDKRAGTFIYGNYNHQNNSFDYDLDIYKRLALFQVNNLKDCQQCISKWHCSGDCVAKVPDINDMNIKRNTYRCGINKALTQNHLERIMQRQIESTQTKIR